MRLRSAVSFVPVRILGIDPGLSVTGYACIELTDAAEPALVEAGVFRFSRRGPMSVRLAELYRDLDALILELAPGRLVVEQIFSHPRHVRTSILMAHARGVVLLVGQLHDVELDELTATEVKKAIAGNRC